MKMVRILGFLASYAVGCLVVSAQSLKVPSTASHVALRRQPPLSAGVDAFPRLVAGGGVAPEVVQKINAALARQDRKVAAAALDCRKSFVEFQHKRDNDAWQRTVEVTMAGPGYLSLLATDSYYCGGPYPNDGLVLPLVYDLATGRPVDWMRVFPAGARSALDTAADGTEVGLVVWEWLNARAGKEADDSCKDAFNGDQTVEFGVWLDASAGEIVAQPLTFPHVFEACSSTVEITVEEARKLGFADEVLRNLERAKASEPQAKTK